VSPSGWGVIHQYESDHNPDCAAWRATVRRLLWTMAPGAGQLGRQAEASSRIVGAIGLSVDDGLGFLDDRGSGSVGEPIEDAG
jgi:hypothetical protein